MNRIAIPFAALGAGAVSAFGFAPWDLWPLTILAVAALLWLMDGAATPRAAFGRAWLFGVGHFAVGLQWIAFAFTFQAEMPAALGWVAVIGLAMFLALYPGLAGWLARRLAQDAVARVLALAAAWMLAEWLRGWVLTGFAWNPLGAAFLPVPGVPQGAALAGSLGLSGLLVLAAGGIWLLARKRWRWGAGLVLLPVLAGLAGSLRPETVASGPPVVIVQPNIGQGDKYSPDAAVAHLGRYLQLSAKGLAAARAPALVVWSESAVPWLIEEEPDLRRDLSSVLRPGDLLLFGSDSAVREGGGRITAVTNSLYVMDATGRLVHRYDKSHLVPLGEYVPLEPLLSRLGLARLVPGDIHFRPGPGPQTLALPGFPAAGALVCYEVIFPGAVVESGRRPAWLVNISNDAWYGPSGPPQHLAQARLRAIEEGLPLARATPTGISAMVDPYGRVTGRLPLGARDALVRPLPAALPPTPFARAGHLVPGLFGLVLAGLALWQDRRHRNI